MSGAGEGVQIEISAEDDFSEAFNDLISESSQASENLGGLAESEDQVASSSEEATSSLQQTTEAAQQTSSSFSSSLAPIAGTAGAIGSLTTSAFGLDQAYTELDNSTLALANAHDNLTKAENNVADANLTVQNAQTKLNELVAEGIDSGPTYTTAENNLTAAQNSAANATESLTNAQNKLQEAQNNQSEASQRVEEQWISIGTSTIPLLLMNFGNFQKVIGMVSDSLDAETLAQGAQTVATNVASAATTVFDAVMDANPIMLVVAAIAALVAIIGVATDGFKNWTPVINVVKEAFSDLEAAGKAVFGFFEEIFGSEIKAWEAALNDLYDIIKPIITGLEDMAGGLSKIGGGLGSVGQDIGSALHLAGGGIISSPTLALVGESGPEAVVPLSGANSPSSPGNQITVHQYNTINRNADAKFANLDLMQRLAANLRTGY